MTQCQAAWCRGSVVEKLWVSLVRAGERGPIFDQRRQASVCCQCRKRLSRGEFVYLDRVALGLKEDRRHGRYQYGLLSIRYWRWVKAKGRWLYVKDGKPLPYSFTVN